MSNLVEQEQVTTNSNTLLHEIGIFIVMENNSVHSDVVEHNTDPLSFYGIP